MYTSQDNVEQSLGRALTVDEAAYFNSVLLSSIMEYIDRESGTSFGNTTDTTVYASGNGTDKLIIPTMWEITNVKDSDGDLISSTLYTPYPATAPYLAIKKTDGEWAEGEENYTVTGKLGYETVPADISAIATEIAVNHFSTKRDTAGSAVKSERVGDYSVTYGEGSLSVASTSVLNGYKRLSRSI